MGGTIRLDYCDVEVFVDVDGEAVAAEVVDDDNQSLGITASEITWSAIHNPWPRSPDSLLTSTLPPLTRSIPR